MSPEYLDPLAPQKRRGGPAAPSTPSAPSRGDLLNAGFAVDAHGQIPADPTKDIRLPSPNYAEKRSLTPAELPVLVAAGHLKGITHVLRLWGDSGIRPSEMYALEWPDIDFDAATVTVKRALDSMTRGVTETKTKGSRRSALILTSTFLLLR